MGIVGDTSDDDAAQPAHVVRYGSTYGRLPRETARDCQTAE